MKVNVGLDIGVASVGYGVINSETGEILEGSARIFPTAEASKNAERRGFRGARRLNNRKKYRLKRGKELVSIFEQQTEHINLYELRVKGLTKALTESELASVLLHLLKRRGVSYLDDVAEDKEVSNAGIEENRRLLKEKYPCEIQLERLETFGKVRGIVDAGGDILVNVFPTSAYKKEAEQLLQTQKKFHPDITKAFEEQYLAILEGKREYFDGPGSENSRTDYGRFKIDGTTLNNLFEILIGKCTIYPEELRGARASYTAQEFDLLNNLNNLSVNGEKLTKEQKEIIISEILKVKGNKVLAIVAKVCGEPMDTITGIPVKDDKPDFHYFKVYKDMRKKLAPDITVEELSVEQLDTLAYILTLNTEYSGMIRDFKAKLDIFDEEQQAKLVAFRQANSKLFNGWHSLSLKAMREIIPEMLVEPKNQMQIFSERGLFKQSIDKYKDKKYLPTNSISQEIYNPIVRRSVNQALHMVNAALKKYGTIDKIVIEMPRDAKTELERKKDAEKSIKANRKEKESGILRAKKEYHFDDSVFHKHKYLEIKLRLWYQQEQRCIYSGKVISVQDLVMNPDNFDIDHIVPISISFDNSLNNKVLCYKAENRAKGNKTPFYYINSNSKRDFADFKQQVEKLHKQKKISEKKLNYLISQENINKWEVRQGFINRHLVDTRYASRTILNELQNFFKAHHTQTKIFVVRGKFTSDIRKRWKLTKDRDESFAHHAIDALLVASVPEMTLWKNKFEQLTPQIDGEVREDFLRLDVMKTEEYENQVDTSPFVDFKDNLSSYAPQVKYSFLIDSKVNRQISDATIYSTRLREEKGKEQLYAINKIKNIYDQNAYKDFLKKYNNDKTQFLMYHHDPQTFESLEEIMQHYSDSDNPFADYQKEHGKIRKYSKKGNGPFITDLKYYQKKVNEHVDITPENANKKVVLLSLKPFRTDVYYNREEERFEFLGIKYADLQFQKGGRYGFSTEKYQELMAKENIKETYIFCFSLYKNDLIRITDKETGETDIFRFLSRTMPNQLGYVELKPYTKSLFNKSEMTNVSSLGKASAGRFIKGLSKKNLKIQKLRTDVLGKLYNVKKEELKLEF